MMSTPHTLSLHHIQHQHQTALQGPKSLTNQKHTTRCVLVGRFEKKTKTGAITAVRGALHT